MAAAAAPTRRVADPRPRRLYANRVRQFHLLLERDDPLRCRYCGIDVDAEHVHIEHLVPVSRGGTSDLANLGLSCGPCNLDKGVRTEDEYRAILDARRTRSAEDLASARKAGRQDRAALLDAAPTDPRSRLQWAQGADGVDVLRIAVEGARERRLTWREIARALAEVESTVRVRYTQRDRTRRYKERRDAEG